MAELTLSAFVARHVPNPEDREFLVLFLDAQGVRDVLAFKQLSESSWQTLESWLTPGTAASLRSILRQAPAAVVMTRVSQAGPPPTASVKIPVGPGPAPGSPVRRPIAIPLQSPPLPPDNRSGRDAEPPRAASNVSPQPGPSPPLPSPPSNAPSAPVAKTQVSASVPSPADKDEQSGSAILKNRQNRVAGVFKESPLRASVPGGDPAQISVAPSTSPTPSLPAYIAPMPRTPFTRPVLPTVTEQTFAPSRATHSGSVASSRNELSPRSVLMGNKPDPKVSVSMSTGGQTSLSPKLASPVAADSPMVNWDHFLAQTKDTGPSARQQPKDEETASADSERERAHATVGWDSFLSETKAQKPPMPIGGSGSNLTRPNAPSTTVSSVKKGATTREEAATAGSATMKRDERRNVGLWSSSKSVTTPTDDTDQSSAAEPKAKDWQASVQVDTTFLLDLAHACSGGRSGAVAQFMITVNEAIQATGALLNISLAGNNLSTENFSPLLFLLRPKLGPLEILDLSSNDLNDAIIPPLNDALSRNQALQDLSLGNNRFTSDGLYQLLSKARPMLRYIDISNARLDNCGWRFTNVFTAFTSLARLEVAYTGLSDAEFALLVGSLPTSLCILNARGNRVVTVPDIISRLICLRHLDLSRNCLEMLTMSLTKMTELDMDFTSNPCLVNPPKETVLAGGSAIRAWLNSYFYGDITLKLRLFVLGHGGVGKTTLLRTLYRTCQVDGVRSANDDNLFSFSSSDPDSYPKSIDLDPKIKLAVADFPGMIETTRTYAPFVSSRNTICMIVLDPSFDDRGIGVLKRHADFWLSALTLKLMDQSTAALRIVLVTTKTDQANKSLLATATPELFNHIKTKFPALPVVDKIYSVTNNFADPEMVKLVKALRKHANDILAPELHSRVPEMFRQVDQAIGAIAQASATVMDRNAFKRKVVASVVDPRIGRYGDFMWSRCLTYLHECGSLLYNPASKNVCVQPESILRLIGSIGVPPAAQRRAYVQTLGPRPVYTMPRGTVLSRMRSLHSLSHCSEPDLIRLLSFMQELELCFELDERERIQLLIDGYWFPALREHAELCMLPGAHVSSGGGPVRFMGIQYAEQNDFVLHEVFLSLQIALRPQFDLNYKIFSNAMLLTLSNARALVHLTESAINFVVAGEAPQVFMNLLWEKLNFASRVRREMPQTLKLCPRCIQGAGIYSTLQSETSCVAGHHLNLGEVEEGALWEKKSWCRNSMWTPKHHEQFFTSGEWIAAERYKYTVLAESDRQPARNKEYCRIRDMFYHFIREDTIRSFELDKIVYIDNLELETQFQQFFEQCAQRFLAYAEQPRGSIEALQNEESLRKEWRRWVMTHFEDYQERVSGNDTVNMVPAWHGTSEEIMFKIAESNFLEPDELSPEKQLDPGYFGKGIYFTQYPSYSTQYVKDNHCLLFSWVIMGRPYPVIESPTDNTNLLGRGLQPGFDSHYVMVRQVSPQVYHPCKTSETPDYDEMVVFTKNQILPRYIIYYRKREAELPVPGGLTPASSASSRYLVWVDDNLHGETKLTLKVLTALNNGITYVQATSTHELIVWIATHEELLTKERETIRVVTNRYRERDGGDEAAKKLLDSLRGDPKTKHLKVLVYCSNPREVAHLEDKKLCFVGNEPKTLRDFAAFRSFGDGARILQPLKNMFGARKESKDSMVESAKDKTQKARAVVWIDDKLSSNASMMQNCAAQGIQLVQLTSTTQLRDWANDQGSLFFPRNVRVITNRYRHTDGGDNAAAQLLQWLRTSDRFSVCEALIFCKDVPKVAHLRTANTAVTDNGIVTSKFCLFEPFERLFPELIQQTPQGGLEAT